MFNIAETMFRLLILSSVFIGVLGKPPQEKCKLTDKPCLLKMANTMYSSLFSISSDLDPMHVEVIEGIFPTLKYTASDTNVKGLKNCQLEELSFDLDELVFNESFICPHLDFDGKYLVSGELGHISMDGNGNYSQSASNYGFHVHSDIELETRDEKKFLNFKAVTVFVDPHDIVKTEINSSGDKKKAAEILKLFSDNWKDNIKVLHGPLMTSYVNEIAKVANEFFKDNSLDDYVIL